MIQQQILKAALLKKQKSGSGDDPVAPPRNWTCSNKTSKLGPGPGSGSESGSESERIRMAQDNSSNKGAISSNTTARLAQDGQSSGTAWRVLPQLLSVLRRASD